MTHDPIGRTDSGDPAETIDRPPPRGLHAAPIERHVDLLDPAANVILNMTMAEAIERVGSGRPEAIRGIEGQFALVHRQGKRIRMARSIGRPLRFFIAKRAAGPLLITADRIDAIAAFLAAEGLADQFHPSYTRMVPAHHVMELALVGCPDPNPVCTRFFTPPRNRWPADLDAIGGRYVGAVATALTHWLDTIDPREPVGVLFSGGIDSGGLLLLLHHLLLARGEPATRLKAFTLSIAADGADLMQAREFLRATGLEFLLEAVEVAPEEIRVADAVRTIEDYKPLDVQAAAATLALCRGIRARHPDWTWLVDGDGGDENLKDYPIEDNPELTIRSVLSNLMLYQEGWGIDAIKHSLTYSGGQSRGHVRTYAPAATHGFRGFSPYALPDVIEVAEGIPFVALTDWDHDRLYAIKGEVMRRGVRAVTGRDMPVFPKRRLQAGLAAHGAHDTLFPTDPAFYRRLHERHWSDRRPDAEN
jgi:asparagine synthase (glutamine-hydrolysing)